MSGKGWSVGRVAEVAGFARAATRGRDERISAHVLVDPEAPRQLVLAVREALMPVRPTSEVVVCPLEGAVPGVELPDVAIALVTSRSDTVAICAYARAGVPVALVVEGALEAPALSLEEGPAALVGVVAASSPEALPDKLAAWLAASTDKELALAANFPFCRRAVVDRLVARCAVENAVVGAVHLIPGSDLPVMTAKQVKLALDVAAAYGRPIEPSRAAEVLGVVGAGLGWRAVARALLGAVPGLGTVLRAGVAYAGTMMTGSALRLRFEAPDAPASPDVAGRVAPAAPVLAGAPGADAPDDGYVTVGGGCR